jgi:hypothetical protein
MIAFLVPTVFFAQEKPKDVSEETTTKTRTVVEDGELVEKKMKVTTRNEQDIVLKDSKNSKENKDVFARPSTITQTVEIDNDKDPYYDSISETVSYSYNNEDYVFKKSNNGFLVAGTDSDVQTDFGRFIITNRSNNYVFTSDDYNGIGYFNANNDFVVEYYDAAKNEIVKKVFTLSQ